MGLIEKIAFSENEQHNLIFKEDKIFFVRKGQAICSLQGGERTTVGEGNIFLIPSGYKLNAVAEKHVIFLIITIKDIPRFKHLQGCPVLGEEDNNLYCLSNNSMIETYLQSLDTYLSLGLTNPEFLCAKITELFCLMENSYDKEALALFFSQYLKGDYSFREQVRLNYSRVKTVRQLADLLHYSYSGFNKRFKRIFGVAAYSWMQQKKARMVYQELNYSEKSLKEISMDYSFVSLSHFNEFCHKELGASPSYIRKNRNVNRSAN